jgi:putative ABC transport system permease protein
MPFERWLYTLPLRIRSLFRRKRVEQELNDEIRDHIERQTAANVAAGMSERDAYTAAVRAFGGVEQRKEEVRDARGVSHIENFLQDIRYAVRVLAKNPGFSVATALTLALGIGGASAVFTVVNGVLIQPLPYPRSGRLVSLSHSIALAGYSHVDQSDATYLMYARDNRVFTDVAVYRAVSVNLGAVLETSAAGYVPRRAAAAAVTPSLFHVLGMESVRGRGINAADGALGAPPVVAISQDLWTSALGADPAIIGRHVAVDGVSREIVGVMPSSFHFPSEQTQIWLPLQFDPAHTNSAAFDYLGVARLRDGVTIGAATADLQRLLPQVPVVFPGRLSAAAIGIMKMHVEAQFLRDVIVGNVSRVLWIVLGAVGMLLLVACANVANLFLARAEGRQREFAVRRALGANRALLLQVSLGEALVLSAIGGALGIALAAAGVGFLHRMPIGASIPRFGEVHVDGVVIAFTIVVSCAAALAVSALPAARSSSVPLASLLVSNGRTATGTRGRNGTRRALVVSQVALGLILVSGATLFARSFQRLTAVNPGFDAEHATAFRLSLPAAAYPTNGDVARTLADITRALRAVPGVERVGVTSGLPLDAAMHSDSAVFVEDHPIELGKIPDVDPMVFVSPDYFTAIGIPLVAGRLFDPPDPSRDATKAPFEVVVSKAFATRYWTATTAVGKRIRMNRPDAWSTIVGVVGDTHDDGLDKAPHNVVYNQLISIAASGMAWTPRDVDFVLRANAPEADLATAARAAVRSVAPDVPVYHVIALRDLLSQAVARNTFTVVLLGIAAVVALAIGAMGIYAVIASVVAMRTREIGVRLALGAQPAEVRRMVVRRAVWDAAIGVVIGLGGAVALGRVLSAQLFAVSPTDPATLAAASVLLILTAVGASWVPATRATRVDPVEAIRAD